ncbi:MAG: tetratricopeptide repeat protein [Saprospiraceae bacterium]|nr:tetratricopeptide repeat protein [Saprospiraceae bacterium]
MAFRFSIRDKPLPTLGLIACLFPMVCLLLFVVGLPNRSLAQSKTDSLWAIWSDAGQHDTVRLKAIQELAWSMMYSHPDSTELLARMELEYAWKINSKKWQGKALNVLGGTYHVRGDYLSALGEYKKALNALMEAGEQRSVAAMFNNIGLIYRERGHNRIALDYYEKYLRIGAALRDNDILASGYNNLGTIYSDQGDFKKALEYYEQALQLAEQMDDKTGVAIAYNNIGSVHVKQENFAKALECYHASLRLREQIDDVRGIGLVHHNIGLIHKDRKDYSQAHEHFQMALRIQEKLGDKPGLANLYYGMGTSFIEQKSHAKAIEWCAKGLAVSEQIGALRHARNTCNCLYEAHKALGQIEKALRWHERYVSYSDSLQQEETSKRLEQMEFAKQILADSLGQEEEKLKMEIAYRGEVRKRDKITNMLLVGGAVVLALAIGFWSRMLYFRRYSQMFQHKAENLEKQHLLNEIALLKTQVNPHFLFNSLSILSSLVKKDPELSEQFIDQLARSYRYILEQKEQSLVNLRTELEFIKSYAFLLKIRFENKFNLKFILSDEVLDKHKIAPMTLQLLIENAVKHNRMSLKEPLVVEVTFDEGGQTLLVKNRLQPRTTPANSTGVGLQNIANRYALLTDRLVWAGEREDEFVVKVPLLQ